MTALLRTKIDKVFANEYCQKVYEFWVKTPTGKTVLLSDIKDAKKQAEFIECVKFILDCNALAPHSLSISNDWSKLMKI